MQTQKGVLWGFSVIFCISVLLILSPIIKNLAMKHATLLSKYLAPATTKLSLFLGLFSQRRGKLPVLLLN